MASKTVRINPEILIWARESAHMEFYDIPQSIIDGSKLSQIENGDALPTFFQLQKLAKYYGRSLGTLLGDKIPENDYIVVPFFRKENKTNYDSGLTLYIRDIQDKQSWARNYLISEGFENLNFVGSVNLNNKPEVAAKKIITELNLPSFSNFSKNKEYLNALKEVLESNNIFVSICGSNYSNKSISLDQAQGIAISDEYAPFIFVNTKNSTNAKIFTLIHEVVHIFLDTTGITEDAINFRKSESREDEIENYCNIVAGEVLMPKDQFIGAFEKTSGRIEDRITKLSKVFLVSELAICLRLWKLGLIDHTVYSETYLKIERKIKQYFEEKERKAKDNETGGNYYNTLKAKNGVLLSSLAYTAYKGGQILSVDLGNILKVKVNNIERYFSTV